MKTILIAFDDSEPSRRALARAAELAKAFGAAVHVTSVARVLVGSGHSMGPYDPTDMPSEHTEQLERARELLAAQGIEVNLDPAEGDPADAIVELAEKVGADLIVVGAHDRSLIERAVRPSVGGAVTRKTHRDVLIVH